MPALRLLLVALTLLTLVVPARVAAALQCVACCRPATALEARDACCGGCEDEPAAPGVEEPAAPGVEEDGTGECQDHCPCCPVLPAPLRALPPAAPPPAPPAPLRPASPAALLPPRDLARAPLAPPPR